MILDHEYSQSGRICTGGGHIKWSCLSAPQWLSGGREPVIRSRRRLRAKGLPKPSAGGAARGTHSRSVAVGCAWRSQTTI